jgi:predicted DNA-binding protein YlxM (UPF0122 family)
VDEHVRRDLLYDFYGGLLTERQRRYWEMHFGLDLSLGEIAGQESVSRQAVQDALKRAGESLDALEERLSLVAEYLVRREKLTQAFELLKELPDGPGVAKVRSLVAEVLDS